MKKKLLSESQVRRFMGLAGIKNINESYMDEDMYEEALMEEEEPAEDEELDVEMEDEDKAKADVEIDEEDLADVAEALDTLQTKLAPLLDQAEGGEGMEEPADDMAMDDEEPAGDDDMDAELGDVDVEPSPEEEKEMQEQIVNEVARRVAKRIVEAKRAHKKMNEALGRKK